MPISVVVHDTYDLFENLWLELQAYGDTTGSNKGGSKVNLRMVTARKENNEECVDLDAQGPMITYSKNFQTQARTNHWKSLSISISAKRT